MHWKERIVELVLVKQRLAAVDQKHLFPHHLPRVAASEASLVEVERKIREPLDAHYRAFLAHAGGWRGFYHSNDLFGPDDLVGSPLSTYADEQLGGIENVVLEGAALRREDLLPIAATRDDLDLFLITRRTATNPGEVIWLAGGFIERFPTFVDYFAAMTEYNRRAIAWCEREMH